MSKSKICRTCKVNYPFKAYYMNSRSKDGKDSQCKFCKQEYEKNRVEGKSPVKENTCTECKIIKPASEFHKNKNKCKGIESKCKSCRNIIIVEKRFGLEKGQLKKMKEQVDFKCEICYNELPLAVDHCHKQGHVRGLLCSNCNNGLGRFKDNIDYLKNAIKYLEER